MRQIIFTKVIFSGSIIFLLFLSIGNLKAQDSIQFKKNEVWVNFFNPGANYKRALNQNTFLKAGVTFDFSIGKAKQDNLYSHPNDDRRNKYNKANQALNIYLGIEKRSILSSKLTLFHGPEISYGLSGNKSKNKEKNKDDIPYHESNFNSQTLGAGYTIGAIYSFNNLLGIGVSWSPRLYYNFTKWENYSHYTNPQYTYTDIDRDNRLGIELSTPRLSLILKL
jgi:hypothetical protein